MTQMTLPFRHIIRNSNLRGLSLSTLPLDDEVSRVDGEETFLFLSNRRDRERSPEL